MIPKFTRLAAYCLGLLTLVQIPSATAQEAPVLFPHPDRIRYDSHCLTIDGKDTFIYSGSFHYFRCPKELWRDRFEKIRAAGFNAVETYVPWNWHEPEMPAGTNDFSKADLSALDEWLTMAEEFGFYVIIRPGPYICAEWDTGGFPQWLLAKKPATLSRSDPWLRTDDPLYLSWCRHWYDAACPVIARHQITHRPPGTGGVILFQLENEYGLYKLPDDVERNQVRALAEYARADGIDVPLFTCWTGVVRGQSDPVLRQIFDTCNFYPFWKVDDIDGNIRQLRESQPWAPLMTTELQGGWFSDAGSKLSQDQDGLSASQINNLTLFALQHGETILNYYMLFGGSNFGGWGARYIITSYDYNAPIHEAGGTGERYRRVWALGHMLREHEARLLRAEAVDCNITKSQDDVSVVMRRALDGSRYVFVRTSQHAEPRQGTAHVKAPDSPELVFDYDLEPFGAKVLYLPPGATNAAQGQWLPTPAPAVDRPTDLPQPVVITEARRQNDGPANWVPLPPGQTLERAGVLDDRFVFYRAHVSAEHASLALEARAGDLMIANINNMPAHPNIKNESMSYFPLPDGPVEATLLYENHGHANFGPDIEEPGGIREAHLLPKGKELGEKAVSGWAMREVASLEPGPEIAPDFDDHDWSNVWVSKLEANNLEAGHTAVFRAPLVVDEGQLDKTRVKLTVGRIDDRGTVYVNGHKVGQTDSWARPWTFDITGELHTGKNTIAIIIHNDDGPGGLGQPTVTFETGEGVPPVPLEFSGDSAGMEAHWWQPDLDDSKWEKTSVGPASPNFVGPALLTWYRMKFELSEPTPGVWVPWMLRLSSSGNGFLYLNGHPLGRYWQWGPQHDFFLPECWLNFGPHETNVLAYCERPISGTAIQQAEIRPYTEFAEFRK